MLVRIRFLTLSHNYTETFFNGYITKRHFDLSPSMLTIFLTYYSNSNEVRNNPYYFRDFHKIITPQRRPSGKYWLVREIQTGSRLGLLRVENRHQNLPDEGIEPYYDHFAPNNFVLIE
jgi:hypothetical protein